MSVVIKKMFNALDAHSLNAIAGYLHDEFMYCSDYEVKKIRKLAPRNAKPHRYKRK